MTHAARFFAPTSLLASFILGAHALFAQSFTSIPAPGRRDIAADSTRGILHITQGAEVLRYDLLNSVFLPPYSIGGDLQGVSVSSDGQWLAVADAQGGSTNVILHVVDLNTGVDAPVSIARDGAETGTFSVAFDVDGLLLVTSSGAEGESGWLRRLDPQGSLVEVVQPLRVNSRLAYNPQGDILAALETGASAGYAHLFLGYDLIPGPAISHGGGQHDIALGAYGLQVALLGDLGLDAYQTYSGAPVISLGDSTNHPAGCAVDLRSSGSLAYVPWAGTDRVRVYEETSWIQVDEYALGETLPVVATNLFPSGRAQLSDDQGFLFVVVDGGVRALRLNANPRAYSQTLLALNEDPVSITLQASDSDGDPLSFSVVTPPSALLGVLSGSSSNRTYTPPPGALLSGWETFDFQVSDGLNVSDFASVSILWVDRPDASSFSAVAREDNATPLSLSARDLDGDPLEFLIDAPPTNGNVVIVGGTGFSLVTAVYVPAPNFHGTDSFSYVVTDGLFTSSTATVSVTVAPVNDRPVAQPGTLTAEEGKTVALVFPAMDVDGDPLTPILGSLPPFATLIPGAPGQYSLFFPLGFSGETSYTFQVSDGALVSAPATVVVTVDPANLPPEPDELFETTVEDTALPVILNAIDPEGDPLTYLVLADPLHGTLSGLEPNLTYTPDANYFGNDSFTYIVMDGESTSTVATVDLTVLPLNEAPTFFMVSSALTATTRSGVIRTRLVNSITPGGAGNFMEAGQAVGFVLTNSRPGLFINQPTIAPNGFLTFRTGSTRGTATLTVFAQDDGGTANGGLDRSSTRTFTITVE